MAVAGDTVSVGCKLPAGLHADLTAPATIMKTPQGEHALAGPLLQRVFFRGSAPQRKLDAAGAAYAHPSVIGGYGITHDVPKDFWERWIADNKDYAPVKAGLIFALAGDKAKGRAKEQAEIKSGLEPLSAAPTKVDGVKIEPLKTDKDDD